MRVATFNSASFLRAYPCPYLSLQRDACAVLGRRRTNGRLPQLQQQQQITRTPAERKIPNAPSTFLSLLRSGPPSRQCTSFFPSSSSSPRSSVFVQSKSVTSPSFPPHSNISFLSFFHFPDFNFSFFFITRLKLTFSYRWCHLAMFLLVTC